MCNEKENFTAAYNAFHKVLSLRILTEEIIQLYKKCLEDFSFYTSKKRVKNDKEYESGFSIRQVAKLTSLGALTSAPLLISISATFSPSLIRAARCNGVSSACDKKQKRCVFM